MKKVSIIIPVYNSSKYLKECLDSVLNQTLKEIEIIIINDGSTDSSEKTIKDYVKENTNIIFINNKKNKGIGYSRNIGVSKSTGEYIGFVDSDDTIEPEMFEKYYNFAIKNKLDIVTGYYYKKFDSTKEMFENSYFNISNLNEMPNLINLLDYGPCNKIFKRELIIKNKINFEEKLKYEDMPFVLKALYHSSKVGHINKAYYNYRIHDSSETTTMDRRVFDMFKIMDIINNYYKDKKEMNNELEYLNISQLTMYALQQKYQKDKKLKKEFINQVYDTLNTNYINWKKNLYYQKTSILKRVIKNNKVLVKIHSYM